MPPFEENILLGPYTTLGIGGPARFFLKTKNKGEITEALLFAKEKSLPFFVIGEGSNIVVSEEGFPGVVIKIEMKKITFTGNGEARAGAGASWDKFVEEAVERNFAGIECLSAIPGTVGSAPIQNIGAYGTEVSSAIKEVHAIDRDTLKEIIIAKEKCQFGYRQSIFNSSQKNRHIITEVVFKLQPDGEPNVSYQDLLDYFGDKKPTLKETREAVVSIRTKKGHVAPPLGLRSAGSFFKNPLLSKEKFEGLRGKVKNVEGKWFWLASPKPEGSEGGLTKDNEIKISAARLIEEAGFKKGARFGNVGISPFHALTLVTYDGATSAKLISLAEKIREEIKNRFDIILDIEPEFVGFRDYPLP